MSKELGIEDNQKRLAAKVLGLSEDELPLEIHFNDLCSIYYSTPGEMGKSVIVCQDGEHLSTYNIVPIDTHIKAFKSGLRSKNI